MPFRIVTHCLRQRRGVAGLGQHAAVKPGPKGSAALKYLMPYIWPPKSPTSRLRKFRIGMAVSLLLAGKVLNVNVPVLFKALIDSVSTLPAQEITDPANLIAYSSGTLLLGFFAAKLGSTIFSELRNVVFSRVTQGVVREIHRDVFARVLSEPLQASLSSKESLPTARSGTLTRTLDRGTRALQFLTTSLVFNMAPTALEIIMVSYLLTTYFGWVYASISIGSIVAYSILTFSLTSWRAKFRKTMNDAENAASNRVLDSLLNKESVKANGKEMFELDQYDLSLAKYEHAALKTASSLAVLNISQSSVFAVAIASMLGLGISSLLGGSMSSVKTAGDLVMMHGLIFQLTIPLSFLGTVYRETRQSMIDLSSIFSLLQNPAAIQTSASTNILSPIVCERVSLNNGHGKNILNDVCVEIRRGERIAIVGQSGSGKSTLAKIFSGLVEPSSGTLVHPPISSICWVSQENNLFHDTILYNVTYGMPGGPYSTLNEISIMPGVLEIVRNSMSMANMYHFVENQWLERIVGERGISLSGGERQRILLARMHCRAFRSRDSILILDEPTGSLDVHSENTILEALFLSSSSYSNIIVITHSVRKIAPYVDRILVMKNGEVVQGGSHSELVGDLSGEYRFLWEKDGLIKGQQS